MGNLSAPRARALLVAGAAAVLLVSSPAASHSSAPAKAAPRTTGEVRSEVDPKYPFSRCRLTDEAPEQIVALDSYDRTSGDRDADAAPRLVGGFVDRESDATEYTFDGTVETTASVEPHARLDSVTVTGDFDLDLTNVAGPQSCGTAHVLGTSKNETVLRVRHRTHVVLSWSRERTREFWIAVYDPRHDSFPLSAEPLFGVRHGRVTGVLAPGRYLLRSKAKFETRSADEVGLGETATFGGDYRYELRNR